MTLGPRRVVRWVVQRRNAAHRYLWTEAPGVEVLAEPAGNITHAEIQALSRKRGWPAPEPGARSRCPR